MRPRYCCLASVGSTAASCECEPHRSQLSKRASTQETHAHYDDANEEYCHPAVPSFDRVDADANRVHPGLHDSHLRARRRKGRRSATRGVTYSITETVVVRPNTSHLHRIRDGINMSDFHLTGPYREPRYQARRLGESREGPFTRMQASLRHIHQRKIAHKDRTMFLSPIPLLLLSRRERVTRRPRCQSFDPRSLSTLPRRLSSRTREKASRRFPSKVQTPASPQQAWRCPAQKNRIRQTFL